MRAGSSAGGLGKKPLSQEGDSWRGFYSEELMESPRVSVVIPTLLDEGRLLYFREMFRSLQCQTLKDIEVILVHNGKSKENKKLIEEYLPHVRYYYTPEGHLGKARNLGVAEARGSYVAFLDDDDLWHRDKLRLQVEAMQNNEDIDLLFTDIEYFGEAGVTCDSYFRKCDVLRRLDCERRGGGLYVQERGWFDFLIERFPFFPSGWLGKRQIFLDEKFDDLFHGEDLEAIWRLSRRFKLAFLDSVLVSIRKHSDNLSGSWDRYLDYLAAYEKVSRSEGLTKRQRRLIGMRRSDCHFYMGYAYRKRGNHLESLRHHMRSLSLRPRGAAVKEIIKNLILLR